MKKYLISVLLILISFLIYDAVPVLANGNPCEDPTKQLQAFVSSLNNKIKAQAGKGLFEVKPIEQEGVVTRWSITYKLSRNAIFLQDVVTNPVMETLKVSANIFDGHSGLIFTYSFGATGAMGCGYAVFPQEGRFTALDIPYPFLIEDFDHDNNVELLILEPEQWGSDCAPARADIPHWPRIFRLETQSGQLVDISRQFPQVYIDRHKEYQARYEELKKEKLLTSECSEHYSRFLERLRQSGLSQGAGNEWDTLNKEVEDLYKAGQYDRAVGLAKKALEVAEKNVGPDHPDVVTSLSSLARLYFAQGKYAQSEQLTRRSLAICEKTLGPDHPDVAASLTNLATIYRKQGQYTQAEPLERRALAIREKSLGPDHPDVAASLNNLAAIYHIQKQYEQAEPLYKRALEIWEKSLGPDHPTVVTTRKNMAALYQATNRGQEVDKLGRQEARISDSYFPLKEGRTWRYQMTKPSMLGSGGSRTLNVTNFATRDLKGKKVTPRKLDSAWQSTFSFIAEDESGIFLYASQSAGAVEPEVKAARSYYLKNPVQVGTTWEEKTATAYLTQDVPLTIKFTIESKNETITVPAGTFNSCVKVKGIGYAQVNMGYMGGVANITVEHHSWYAPDVGLVRSIKKELSNNMMLGSFGETLELESFKK